MKNLLFILVILLLATGAWAVPAKRNIWKTFTLSDGTEVRARLYGDEHLHFWLTNDGLRLTDDGSPLTEHPRAMSRMPRNQRRLALAPQHAASRQSSKKAPSAYIGKKKGLIILAEFTDVKFKKANNLDKYLKIINEPGYTSSEGFQGSVADYFRDQSGGLFDLTFDVYGPVSLSRNQKYYGENNSNGDDMHAEDMIVEACDAINDQVDFKDYDWDGDGYVDEVFVIYAGKGEADGGGSNTIWPHMYELSETDHSIKRDGVIINVYACGNEIDSSGKINGIGTICHEFSHCLGYPDFYDSINGKTFGMSFFDLMDAGCYNGDGFIPAGYSAYEKWVAGWIELTELAAEDVTVDSLKPVSEGGHGYIIYNDDYNNEYYVIENRQMTNWDAGLYGKGLMITHVDYDEDIWYWNIPNSILTADHEYVKEYGYPTNDHVRFTIFHADNADTETYSGLMGDLYPYTKSEKAVNDSLTANSKPAATLYHPNAAGDKFMHGAILDIQQNTDGTMGFYYRAPKVETGIRTIANNQQPTADSKIYDLQGRCINGAEIRSGIYIRQGKKIIVPRQR